MDEDEDRQWVLVEKMASDMQAIKEQVSLIPEMNERLGRVEIDLAEVKTTVRSHTIILKEHSADIRALKADLGELKADVKEIKQIVGGHAEAIVELKLASHTH